MLGDMKYCILYFILMVSNIASGQNVDYNEFEGTRMDVKFTTRLVNAKFIEYRGVSSKSPFLKIDASTNSGGNEIISAMAKRFNNLETDSTDNYIALVHTLMFDYGNRKIAIIKFSEVKNGKNNGFRIIQLEKIKEWEAVENIQDGLDDIRYCVKTLTTEGFWEFYNKSESEYPIVNQLRKQVKDEHGITSLFKLAEVIKENKGELANLCHF